MGKAVKNILADLGGQAAVIGVDNEAHVWLTGGGCVWHGSGIHFIGFQGFSQQIAWSAFKFDKGVVDVG